MSRNHEKHHGMLNRIWLDQLRKEEAAKKPKRPRLSELHTAQDVAKWIFDIEEDINFCLQQSQVRCYTETKVQEYYDKIAVLKNEHKAFRRKLNSFGGNPSDMPGTARPYSRKRFLDGREEISSCKVPAFIPTPLLDLEIVEPPKEPPSPSPSQSTLATGNWTCIDPPPVVQNTRLDFPVIPVTPNPSRQQAEAVASAIALSTRINNPDESSLSRLAQNQAKLWQIFGLRSSTTIEKSNSAAPKPKNPLGLEYDSD